MGHPQQISNQSQRHNYANQIFQSQPNFRNFSQNSVRTFNRSPSNSQPNSLAIDTDVSMRTVRSNNFQGPQANKRGLMSNRQIPQNIQRVDHLIDEMPQNDSQINPEAYTFAYDPNLSVIQKPLETLNSAAPIFGDEINLLEEGRFSPTSSE